MQSITTTCVTHQSGRVRLRPVAIAATLVALAFGILACGEDAASEGDGLGAPGGNALAATDVHSLSVNPDTGALLIATHDGLFELEGGQLEQVGDLRDDLMGFDIAGPSTYVASGHPDVPEAGAPPHLGLIASDDGGRNWMTVALEGQADFHALAAQGSRIYGYDGLRGELLRSDDAGRSWEPTEQVGVVVDLAIDPADPDRVLASTEEGLSLTEDGGASWNRFQGPPGLVAWTTSEVYVFDAFGKVLRGDEDRLDPVGRLGKLPVAVTGIGERLYIATDEGEILESPDGGENWQPSPVG